MSKHPTLLAIDQSSMKSGLAVFDGTDLMRWDLLKASENEAGDFRITEMVRNVEAYIKIYRPKMLVFEGIQNQRSPQTVILLARLQGMLMRLCDQYHLAYEIYQPTAWRSILGFKQGQTKRAELKAQAMDYVKASYGIDINEDTSEAICIGLAHLKRNGALPDLVAKSNKVKQILEPDIKKVKHKERKDV